MVGMDAALASLADRVAPVTLAAEQRLSPPPPLQPVVPEGGLQRGWSLAVAGVGSWSLASALVAPIQAADRWAAVVGAPAFGLTAAAGYGVRLDRVLVVDQPPADRWATVVAALVDAVDVVLVAPGGTVARRDARRLQARARERGAVLIHLDGGRSWPDAPDVALTVERAWWEGIEVGHGHLRARRAVVAGSGRRLPGPVRRTELWLPAPDGSLATAIRAEDDRRAPDEVPALDRAG